MNSEVSTEQVIAGALVKVKVGCRIIEAVVLEALEHGWRVKSNASGKVFETRRIVEVINTGEATQIETAEITGPGPVEESQTEETPASETETTEVSALAEVEPAATPAKKRSLINAAAEILKESGEAMNTRNMVKLAIERELWTPTACKTPEQSLYGAIFREIKVAEQPRFRKSQKKGAFEYAL